MLFDRDALETALTRILASIRAPADPAATAEHDARLIADQLATPEDAEAMCPAIEKGLRDVRPHPEDTHAQIRGQRRNKVMIALAYHGWLDTEWRPIHEWRPDDGEFHGGSIWLRGHCGRVITLSYLDRNRQLQSVELTPLFRMDDGGPWVGQVNEEQWVLISSSWWIGCSNWSLCFTPGRPRQWFEDFTSGR